MRNTHSYDGDAQTRCEELASQSERIGLYAAVIAEWAQKEGKKLDTTDVMLELMNFQSPLILKMYKVAQGTGVAKKQCDDELIENGKFIVDISKTILDVAATPETFEDIRLETIRRVLERAGVDINLSGISAESH